VPEVIAENKINIPPIKDITNAAIGFSFGIQL
jgi:hypothetical protein